MELLKFQLLKVKSNWTFSSSVTLATFQMLLSQYWQAGAYCAHPLPIQRSLVSPWRLGVGHGESIHAVGIRYRPGLHVSVSQLLNMYQHMWLLTAILDPTEYLYHHRKFCWANCSIRYSTWGTSSLHILERKNIKGKVMGMVWVKYNCCVPLRASQASGILTRKPTL